MQTKAFQTVLIANRGEIACRIIKSLRQLNIEAATIYSSADKNALHTKLADTAYLIGPPPPLESYLNIEKIIALAKAEGITAIHPGYGFLAENADFAAQCEQANITFIGPNSQVIAAMANKAVAKELMQKYKVPILPSLKNLTDTTALQAIGMPILIKASLGGGGKGMRIVNAMQDFTSSLESCQREAKQHTGSDAVIVEKYLPKARHVEVQIVADNYGNVAHLGTRDCSIQRRYQKIIEEAPANIPPKIHDSMTNVAIAAAKGIGYTGVGTFEFLYADKQFYFMEMNTRLQVEHAVTEAIFNVDLVAIQIKISQGMTLAELKLPTSSNGHAIEARIYAEDPTNSYLPATGFVEHLHLPTDAPCRIDNGLQTKDYIGIYYDPMLAKIIATDTTRSNAITKLVQALDTTHIVGVTTNLIELRCILNSPPFKQDQHYNNWLEQTNLTPPNNNLNYALIALSLQQLITNNNTRTFWRLNLKHQANLQLWCHNKHFKLKLTTNLNGFNITINDSQEKYSIDRWSSNNSKLTFTCNKQQINTYIYKHQYGYYCAIAGQRFLLSSAPFAKQQTVTNAKTIAAPITGILRKILAQEKQQISAKEPILVLEAMKMEHTILAQNTGRIKSLHYTEGDTIHAGDILISME